VERSFAEPLFSSESIAEAAAGTAVTAKLGCEVGHSIVEAPIVLDRHDASVKVVMEGVVVVNDPFWRLTGQWRLGWSHKLSSEFEWRSCDTSADSEIPCSGCYEGHFHLQTPTGIVRCEEQELDLSFTENAKGGFNIDGKGRNQFGSFSVRGIIFENRSFEVVKFVGLRPGLHQEFMQLLQYTGSAAEARWFKKPVSKNTLGYKDIITTPMDLQTLRDNLKKHRYRTPDDFIADARLIFTNAWTFNSPGSPCYHAADVIYLRFESRLFEITGEPLPQNVATVEARVQQHRDAQGQKKRKRPSDRELTQEIDLAAQRGQVGRAGGGEFGKGRGGRGRGRGGRGATAATPERRRLDPPWEPVPLSDEEKWRLQERIDGLEEADLDSVLDFLSDDQTLDGSESGEISLDLDALTPARQRALVDFVDLKRQTISNNGG